MAGTVTGGVAPEIVSLLTKARDRSLEHGELELADLLKAIRISAQFDKGMIPALLQAVCPVVSKRTIQLTEILNSGR